MEFNFIEEVSKALDVLSVERLVRTSPMGSVRCKKCNKILYTATQAQYAIMRMYLNDKRYMEMYPCQEQEGEHYHLTDLEKRQKKLENTWLRREIELKKQRLDERYKGQAGDAAGDREPALGAQNLVVVDGRIGSTIPYTKALRRKILRALAIPVQGLRKPRTHRFRRSFKPPRRTPRRDMARTDLPRGETMTKMLSWPNGKHYSPKDCAFRDGADDKARRRRNRSREAEAVRREAERETSAPVDRWEAWTEHRSWDNDEGLRFIDFDGSYTCE